MRQIVLGLVGLALAACATGARSTASVPAPADPLSPPGGLPMLVTPEPGYVLQLGDQVAVRFYYHPDHDQEVTVRPDGMIALRGVGEVAAVGLRPQQLADHVAARYSDVLRDPQVHIQVARFAALRVYVGGEVGRPGFVQLTTGMTALQAVVEAGGFRDTAKLESVVVMRRLAGAGGPRTESMLINLEEVVEQQNVAADLRLQPYDVVFVPKTVIAKLNEFVDKYIIRMIPVRTGLGLAF